jgi:hypothetical protein
LPQHLRRSFPKTPQPTKHKSIGKSDIKSKLSQLDLKITEVGIDQFWHYRESPQVTFDWFKTYEDLKPKLNETIPSKDASILMLGCGNSSE